MRFEVRHLGESQLSLSPAVFCCVGAGTKEGVWIYHVWVWLLRIKGERGKKVTTEGSDPEPEVLSVWRAQQGCGRAVWKDLK